ncbi:MAG: S8 family serine peptidase [Ignavibacteriaceae bacterium]|nr:MAG: S8 family serine peptidase [Ignavibacteriaceae bacterium]
MFFKSVVGKTLVLCLMALFALSAQQLPQRVITKGDIHYLSNELIIKFKYYQPTDVSGKVTPDALILSKMEFLGAKSVNTVFPPKAVEASSRGIERIVSLKYGSNVDPLYAAAKLSAVAEIEWIEPRYVYSTSGVPNDPQWSRQWFLPKIKAAEAWDINQGTPNIIIGIVDTGVDWDHPDLVANVWINPNEIPGNGIDDDGNGYIDDVRGWDFGGANGTPDNNPMEDQPDHGTHVAGCASACTNNGIGVAGIGYNSRVMAVKTSRNDQRDPASGAPYVVYGYEGILYAAQNGCKVINCSWGGGGFSMFGQDIINQATDMGAAVIAAAGNESSREKSYPASYDNVLSVVATTSTDGKAGFSNYGYYVDVSAPGNTIYSTWQNDTYTNLSGTSMASPITAGLVALTLAQFPSLTPLQAAEKVRVSVDNIDNNNTASLKQLLGKGRINALKALQENDFTSVRAILTEVSDSATGNNDGIFQPGETVTIYVKFKNWLNPTSNLSVTLESKSPYATVSANATANFGAKQTGEVFDNQGQEFQVTLAANTPENSDIGLLLTFSDGAYSDFQWIGAVGNPTYATTMGNKVAATITSTGIIGYADYPDNLKGKGFKYDEGNSMLFEGSLMLGTAGNQIINSARGSDQSFQDKDYQQEIPFSLKIPGDKADVEGFGVFNDNLAGGSKLGLQITQRTYNYSQTADENYIIVRYTIKNTSAAAINGLYAGLFFDWDMVDGQGDLTEWYAPGNYARAWNNSASMTTKVGTALISRTNYSFQPIANDGSVGGINIYDGFTDFEKWTALSSGVVTTKYGPMDISHVIGGGPYNIAAGDSIEVAFALAAADSDVLLDQAISNARGKWSVIMSASEAPGNLPLSFSLLQNYPNPFNPETVIRYSLPTSDNVVLTVYNSIGEKVASLVNEVQEAGYHEAVFNAKNLPSGLYFYRIESGSFTATKKMVLLK